MFEKSLDILNQHALGLNISSTLISQLLVVEQLTEAAYYYDEGLFQEAFEAEEKITPQKIRSYAAKHGRDIFISHKDKKLLSDGLENKLIKIARSLSIGDPLKNGVAQTNFLSMSMANLYKNPFNNQHLTTQFKSASSLCNFLDENKKIQKAIYHNISSQSHHFTVNQPLLTSIMLFSFIKHLKLFNDNEAQNLFLTSYFKDVGMSFIPENIYDKSDLSDQEKEMFLKHSTHSLTILEGRIPLTRPYLEIIKHHHFLSDKLQGNLPKETDNEVIGGIEMTLVGVMDILVAMTCDRPYRERIPLFTGLELIKNLIADDYPQEFKALVKFVSFFLNK